MAIDSKRIAKNTIFLYARLILVMGVTLYASRVVLDKLGVDDFGLYNVVFSVIGLLSFLNGTLSIGTSRFITFELGKNSKEKLKATFSTALGTHCILALFILLIGETFGIWYVYNVLVCPPDRFQVAFLVYQISIFQTMITIIQVPFTSEIIAHEKMDFYAYIGIYEAVAKLLVVFLLIKTPFDKLLYYAVLVALVSFSLLVISAVYCRKHFEEVCLKGGFDKSIFRSLLGFSGWNIIANISETLMRQGVIMLFNIFFLPVVVAAQAISNQISNAMMQFVGNVRQAVNPQVIKLYADQQYDNSKKLTLQSTELVFYLLLLLGVPLIMIMPNLLNLWLVEVPQYTVEFARLVVIQDILGNFSTAFYTPMVAANRIQKNSIASIILCTTQFGLMYLLFHLGFGPIWARYLGVLFCIIWSFVVKPYILWKDINYTWSEMLLCIAKCLRVLVVVAILCYIVYRFIPQPTFSRSVVVAGLSAFIVILISYMLMEKSMRVRLNNIITNRIKNKI